MVTSPEKFSFAQQIASERLKEKLADKSEGDEEEIQLDDGSKIVARKEGDEIKITREISEQMEEKTTTVERELIPEEKNERLEQAIEDLCWDLEMGNYPEGKQAEAKVGDYEIIALKEPDWVETIVQDLGKIETTEYREVVERIVKSLTEYHFEDITHEDLLILERIIPGKRDTRVVKKEGEPIIPPPIAETNPSVKVKPEGARTKEVWEEGEALPPGLIDEIRELQELGREAEKAEELENEARNKLDKLSPQKKKTLLARIRDGVMARGLAIMLALSSASMAEGAQLRELDRQEEMMKETNKKLAEKAGARPIDHFRKPTIESDRRSGSKVGGEKVRLELFDGTDITLTVSGETVTIYEPVLDPGQPEEKVIINTPDRVKENLPEVRLETVRLPDVVSKMDWARDYKVDESLVEVDKVMEQIRQAREKFATQNGVDVNTVQVTLRVDGLSSMDGNKDRNQETALNRARVLASKIQEKSGDIDLSLEVKGEESKKLETSEGVLLENEEEVGKYLQDKFGLKNNSRDELNKLFWHFNRGFFTEGATPTVKAKVNKATLERWQSINKQDNILERLLKNNRGAKLEINMQTVVTPITENEIIKGGDAEFVVTPEQPDTYHWETIDITKPDTEAKINIPPVVLEWSKSVEHSIPTHIPPESPEIHDEVWYVRGPEDETEVIGVQEPDKVERETKKIEYTDRRSIKEIIRYLLESRRLEKITKEQILRESLKRRRRGEVKVFVKKHQKEKVGTGFRQQQSMKREKIGDEFEKVAMGIGHGDAKMDNDKKKNRKKVKLDINGEEDILSQHKQESSKYPDKPTKIERRKKDEKIKKERKANRKEVHKSKERNLRDQ